VTAVQPATKRSLAWRFLWHELPLDLVLVALWCLLWGSLSPMTLLTGVVLAVGVTRAFVLPKVDLGGRLDPVRLVVFLAVFAWQLVTASFQVAWLAVAGDRRMRSSIVVVPMRAVSEMTLGMTAIAVSLVPGSFVVDLDAERRELVLHVLNTRTADDVARAKASVQATEDRLIRAIGSTDDLEATR
jgi:multicomponent Na+:H+ antiporter subunit E